MGLLFRGFHSCLLRGAPQTLRQSALDPQQLEFPTSRKVLSLINIFCFKTSGINLFKLCVLTLKPPPPSLLPLPQMEKHPFSFLLPFYLLLPLPVSSGLSLSPFVRSLFLKGFFLLMPHHSPLPPSLSRVLLSVLPIFFPFFPL